MSKLSDFSKDRPYQQSNNPSRPRADRGPVFETFDSCYHCGARRLSKTKEFIRNWVNPISILGIFLGLLPFFILRYILTVRHEVAIPYCDECDEKYEQALKVVKTGQIALIVAIPLLFIEVFTLESAMLSGLIFLGSFVLLSVGAVMKYFAGPKYKRTTQKFVTVNAPGYGEIRFDKVK